MGFWKYEAQLFRIRFVCFALINESAFWRENSIKEKEKIPSKHIIGSDSEVNEICLSPWTSDNGTTKSERWKVRSEQRMDVQIQRLAKKTQHSTQGQAEQTRLAEGWQLVERNQDCWS